jgi:hypothetical protein
MFWFALLIFAVGLGALLWGIVSSSRDGTVGVSLGVFLLLLGGVLTVVSCLSVVPPRYVGIVTSFTKPTGETTGAGVQWTKPWETVQDFDASGQSYAHLGDACVWVSIAAQRRSCIPVQIEWAANPERAPENWAAYREIKIGDRDLTRFETFTERRVNPQINGAIISMFKDFDPLKTVDAKSGDAPAPDLNATYRDPLRKAIEESLGEDIVVKSVVFEAPRYDDPTTKAIEAYGQKILEARNLTIDEQNAKTRARITATDASVDQVARCLQIAEKLGKEPGLCMNPLGALAQTGSK